MSKNARVLVIPDLAYFLPKDLRRFWLALSNSLRHVKHCLCPFLEMNRFSPSYSCPRGHSLFDLLGSLPFLTLSSALSLYVPKNRCFGFTQLGLSQLWQTSNLPGSSLYSSTHANLCADQYTYLPLSLMQILPYPFRLTANQFQHSSALRTQTLSQNLRMNGGVSRRS